MRKEVLAYYLHKEGAALSPDRATRKEKRKFRKLKRLASATEQRLDAYVINKHKDLHIRILREMANDPAVGHVIVRDSDFPGFSAHGYAYHAKVLSIYKRPIGVKGIRLFCICEIIGLYAINFDSTLPPRKNGARVQVEVSMHKPEKCIGPYGPLRFTPEHHVAELLAREAQSKQEISRKMQRLTELEQITFAEQLAASDEREAKAVAWLSRLKTNGGRR